MKYTKKKHYIKKQTYTNKQTYSNKHILKILTLVKDYYKEKNDKTRANSYEKALYQISKWNKPIKKGSEIAHLDGIGKGMIEKIDTILSSGTLPILDDIHLNTKLNKEVNTILNNTVLNNKNLMTNKSLMTNKTLKNTQLKTILGFGNAFVNELINKHNARTIQDVKKLVHTNKIKLTHIQELGLKYYKDLQSFIPRDEITYLTNKLKEIINNTNYTMLVSGSYPSNTKKKSKDIDILVVKHSNNKEQTNIHSGDLYKIINKIKNKSEDINKDEKINKDEDINEKNNLENISLGDRKFMGLIKSPLSNKMRHLDMRLVTIEELPYTWLYYSSGRMFNKIIRQKLKKKGYKLNEYGLYKDNEKVKVNSDEKINSDGKVNSYEKVNSDDKKISISIDNTTNKKESKLLNYIKKIEQEIFKIASMDYKSVQERY